MGGRAFAVAAELLDPVAIEAMCVTGIKGLGGIDIVMNNAGLYIPQAVVESDRDTWQKTLSVNLEAPQLITRITLQTMIEQGTGGKVVIHLIGKCNHGRSTG